MGRDSFQVVTTDAGRWLVCLHWDEIDGRAEVVGIQVWSQTPTYLGDKDYERLVRLAVAGHDLTPAPLTTKVLRGIALGSLIAKVRQRWVTSARRDLASGIGVPEDVARETLAMFGSDSEPGKTKRRRSKYGPAHWAEVARVYLTAYEENRSPTRAVQKHFGVSESLAARWVWIARHEKGLLPKTRPGVASAGEPGPDREEAKE